MLCCILYLLFSNVNFWQVHLTLSAPRFKIAYCSSAKQFSHYSNGDYSRLRRFPRIFTKVDYGTERVNHLFSLMASSWSGFLLFQVFFSSMRSGSSCQIYFMTLNKPGLANWWGKTSHHGDLMGNSQGILSRNTPVSLQSRLPCQHCTIFEMLPW